MTTKHLLLLSVTILPISASAEPTPTEAAERPKGESKQLSASYLDRADALPYVLQTLMDQHSRRVSERGTTRDDVYLGALQSVLASLEDARKAFVETSQKDTALTKDQRTLVTKLKAMPQTKLTEKKRTALTESEIITLLVREKTEISPIIRQFHIETSKPAAGR